MESRATDITNPPSRAPNCIGEKNIRLANKDVNAKINILSKKLASAENIYRMIYISRHDTTLAINSSDNEVKKVYLLFLYKSFI